MKLFIVTLSLAFVALGASALDEPGVNSTTLSSLKRLYTYAGPLLPSDWTLVSILNDRVVIGFENGTARNARLEELDNKDRTFIQRLQNGTVVATPLASAKEKLSQWSSTVTSTVSKFGKSVRDQFDSLISSNDKNKNPTNITMLVN